MLLRAIKFLKFKNLIASISLFISLNKTTIAQNIEFSSANPLEYLIYEHNENLKESASVVRILRPFVSLSEESNLKSHFTYINFLNNGHSNIDNNGNRISFPNLSAYGNFTISFLNKFLYIKLSPQLIESTREVIINDDPTTFSYLNDRPTIKTMQPNMHLPQSTIALHYNYFAIGASSENMWFGPGFHSSLSMSNNARGFNHYFIGTLNEIKIKKMGLNFRYFVSERKNLLSNKFYHTALASTLSIYSNPTITLGFSRAYLSGGLSDFEWSINDASKLVFEPLFGNSKDSSPLSSGEPIYWEPWDQILTGFIDLYFPKDKIHLYLEIGSDDSRANLTDFLAHWDHALGYVIGFKKSNLFNNNSFLFAMEYSSTKNSTNTLNPEFYRGNYSLPLFYDKELYLRSSFQGRRWVAHSGSDADDFIVLFGSANEINSLLFSFSIERRGIFSKIYPERKFEGSIIASRRFRRFDYKLYIEKEKIFNYGFINSDNSKNSLVFGAGFDYFFQK